jgi:hypothetical protein
VYRRNIDINKSGIKATLRSLFYWAADAERILVHSQVAYRELSAHYSRYREEVGYIDVLEKNKLQFSRRDGLSDLEDPLGVDVAGLYAPGDPPLYGPSGHADLSGKIRRRAKYREALIPPPTLKGTVTS